MSDYISSVNKTSGGTNLIDGKTSSTQSDKDMFLKLLVTQMKNQDPTKPTDNSQMLAQMAQFTSLEQMQNMNSSITQQKGYSMLGKTVTGKYQDLETNMTSDITGVVESVIVKDGEVYLNIDNKMVKATSVSEVTGDANITGDSSQGQTLNLVGKNIQAILIGADGKPTDFIEGKVDFIDYTTGMPMLSIDGKKVYPNEVLTVSDSPLLKGNMITISTKDAEGAYTYENKIISNIKFDSEGNANLTTVDGGSYPISKINNATDALQLIGNTVSAQEKTGVVTGILLENGDIYVNLDTGDKVLYTDIRDGK